MKVIFCGHFLMIYDFPSTSNIHCFNFDQFLLSVCILQVIIERSYFANNKEKLLNLAGRRKITTVFDDFQVIFTQKVIPICEVLVEFMGHKKSFFGMLYCSFAPLRRNNLLGIRLPKYFLH